MAVEGEDERWRGRMEGGRKGHREEGRMGGEGKTLLKINGHRLTLVHILCHTFHVVAS